MRIHHLALRVLDCERAAAFYSGVLGLDEIRRHVTRGKVRAIWLRAGETILMLETSLRGVGAETGSSHVLVFDVEDLPEWEARLARAGVLSTDRTEKTLYLNDPDGHRVGLTVFGTATP